MDDPRSELRSRLAARRYTAAALDRSDARLAWGRLAVFSAAAALAWATFARALVHPAWLLAPAFAFLALAVRHDGVLRARARARRAITFHEAALTRMDGGFPPGSNPGERFLDPEHPYAADLDLFGPASLFALLSTARTGPGEARLAAWLLHPADAAEVTSRQRAAAALAPALDLREDLAVLGEDVRAGVDPAGLAAWGEAPRALAAWVGPAALGLGGASIAAAAAWWLGLGPLPLLAVLAAHLGLSRAQQGPLLAVMGGVQRPSAELRVLALLLARLEREPFAEPRLATLAARLRPSGAAEEIPASAAIAGLVALVLRLEWGKNQLFAPIAFALAWFPLHAAAIERWRAAHGRSLRAWMEAAGEIEALAALGGHRHEHPDHVVPEVLTAGAPSVEGEGVRHPLLRGAVPNPVALGGAGPRALLVSGSNMSGKSTYLRTVGVNVVLALAGGVVPATSLRLTPLQAGATLRIQDSLQAGRSRFYAEITRLKALSDLARGPFPLLFLLDEILHGTNSHDRRAGAEALVRGLLERGAIGLVTTHDLALTELAGRGDALANAHFQDQVVEGEIAFDYRLHPGVVEHSNAIALMRAVGLDV